MRHAANFKVSLSVGRLWLMSMIDDGVPPKPLPLPPPLPELFVYFSWVSALRFFANLIQLNFVGCPHTLNSCHTFLRNLHKKYWQAQSPKCQSRLTVFSFPPSYMSFFFIFLLCGKISHFHKANMSISIKLNMHENWQSHRGNANCTCNNLSCTHGEKKGLYLIYIELREKINYINM